MLRGTFILSPSYCREASKLEHTHTLIFTVVCLSCTAVSDQFQETTGKRDK